MMICLHRSLRLQILESEVRRRVCEGCDADTDSTIDSMPTLTGFSQLELDCRKKNPLYGVC
jgi:hypothetical protein